MSVLYIKRQFLCFVVVGIFNTAMAYAVYALALVLGFPYPAANFIALVSGIAIGYATQGKFVFNRLAYHTFWRFLLCWGLIYCANVAIIRQLIGLGFDPFTAGALALPVIVPISFMVQKYLVFTDWGAAPVSRFPGGRTDDRAVPERQ